MTPYHHTPRYIQIMLGMLALWMAFNAFFEQDILMKLLASFVFVVTIVLLLLTPFLNFVVKPTKQAKKFECFDPHPEIN